MNVLGVMSGTSLDGLDAVLVRFEGGGDAPLAWEIVARASEPYEGPLRERLVAAIRPGGADVVELTRLHAEVGERVADLVQRLQRDGASIDLVAMSGQTVWHEPRVEDAPGARVPSTLQIGEPSRVVARCDLPVASDLRQGDLAEGGQAAPMVSFGDWMLFGRAGVARAVQNLGGIANLTWLPPDGDPERVRAFDTGPSNCLLDELADAGLGRPFDEDGRVAATGRVDEAVLARLMDHPYLRLAPPKTTGREEFNLRELAATGLPALPVADALATAVAYTVASVADAYRRWVVPDGLDEVLLAGGGARNPRIVDGLRRELGALGADVRTFEEIGLRSSDREAVAFALMGYELWHRRPNVLPAATGARRAAISGRLGFPVATPRT